MARFVPTQLPKSGSYTDGLSLGTRGCRSSLKSPIPKVSKALSEALLCDSSLDNRSLTLPIRQGTKEGPTPSPPEVTVPHPCLCGLPGRDGRRGTSARGDTSSPYPRGSPPPRPGRPRAGRHRLRRRERPSDGLAAGVDHLRHPGQQRGALRPAVADLGAVVAQLPGVRPRPGRGVRPEPRGHVLALGPPVLGGGGSWASAAYRSDQA